MPEATPATNACLPRVLDALWSLGLPPTRVDYVFLTHVHLDHAGGAGAMVYALHCPELQAPFLAVWYVAGIALVVLAGALLGRFVLRW